MSFTDGIPLNGQSLGDSRDLVRNNFSTLRTAMQVNHLNINGANSGKHDFVEMVNRATPTILANESALYSRSISGVTQLCLTGDANGEQYVMTRMDTANYATFGLDIDGWTFLPGRLLFQYGFKSSPGTTGTITLPRAFTGTNYTINLTLYRNTLTEDDSICVKSGTPPTTTQFTYVLGTAGASGFYWTAIGF